MMKTIVISFLIFFINVPLSLASDEQIKLFLAKPFLKAEFSKIRKLKILSRPFNTSGKVLFLSERGLVWETIIPLKDVLFISNHGVGYLDKDTNKRIEIDNPAVISASNVFISIISLDLNKIKKIFEIKVMGSTNGVQRYVLLPKDENLKKVIKEIKIKGKERVEEILILEISGDSTRVLFKNEKFEQDVFSRDERILLEML